MMKNLNLYILALSSITLFSCDDFLGDNVDPNKQLLENLGPADLLPTSIEYTSSAFYGIATGMCLYSQQLAAYTPVGANIQQEIQLEGGWSNIYLQALPDIETLNQLALDANSTGYQGIAKVLKATNLGLATDQWGDVPGSTATQGEQDFTPAFEAQEDIYIQINILLDDAIALLSQADTTVGSQDLIYGGDLTKWIKTAYFLKAKYAIHTTEVDQAAAVAEALSNVSNSYTSNADDYQLMYTTRNFNPWNAGVVLPRNTGNLTLLLSDQLVSLMDGSQLPYDVITQDPRLPLIASLSPGETEYLGAINGTNGQNQLSPSISATADLGAENFYSSQTAPIVMGSYSELMFIQAEALFLQNGGTATSTGSTAEAYTAYLTGIEANLDKVGVSTANKAAYLSDTSIAVGAANLTLELIMREKFIATFLNPESFVDLRRYNFNPAVFTGLALPENLNPDLNGKWARRAQYPASEQTRNGAEIEKVTKSIDTGVWWDKD
ncbi:SusD/RagB family nutrient-binding outer membrane lipoprotein [Leeuwenhoekiella sp. W20_SRS_FM14]|uniref:SusD/RagB family nutrient-binding outer membrane lipoprotein n=1 Tax=Leeuwenhoekiella sp. W20_SRS_FM14 TaxID=3240270 RepID=UPI003F958FB3